VNAFSDILCAWYARCGRDLPWRRTRDPYLIWLSEVILQQTRVEQGMEYYLRFVARFPDVGALAAASEEEVLKLWQGLGYYSRARNLHRAARQIAGQYGGRFPERYDEVRALPGVGEYTAAAICSFAYDDPRAVLDGNVFRVLSRAFDLDEPIDSTAGRRRFAELAASLLPPGRAALHNQAIMDFGALQCVPSSPSCLFCPLSDSCVALQKNLVDKLPWKARKTKVLNRYFSYIYVRAGVHTFIKRREAGDIWQNLYEFPLIETEQEVGEEEIFSLPAFRELVGNRSIRMFRVVSPEVKHVLSHRVIHARCYEVELEEEDAVLSGFQRVLIDDLHKFPVSRLISRFFSLLLKPNYKK
jgi:A/G-specific adenine glycosylase